MVFRLLAESYAGDESAAREIFLLLERIHVHAPAELGQKYAQVFQSVYGASNDQQLKDLAANVASRLIEVEFELVNIFDSIDSQRESAISRLRQQVLDALGQSRLSQDGYQRIFAAIKDIARAGQYEVARELAGKLNNKLSVNSTMRSMLPGVEAFWRQLLLVGKTFATEALLDFEGKPLSLRHPDAGVKAICFFGADSRQEADSLIFSVMGTAGRFIGSRQFCLTAAFIDYGDNPEAIAEVKHTTSLIRQVDFCRVDATSEGGRELLESMSISSLPMLMLLDQRNTIIGMDVSQIDFEKRFLEHLKNR